MKAGGVGLKIVIFILILLNLTDNVIGAFLHGQLANSAASLQVLYLKYVILALLFVGFIVDVIYGERLKTYEWCGFAYLVSVVILSIAISVLNPGDNAGSRLYLYFFPVLIYFAGKFVGRRAEFGTQYVVGAYMVNYLALAGIFLVLNIAVGAVAVWRDYLNYAGFILDVKGFTDDAIDGLHGNFYYSFGGTQIPRFLGSFGDPLALAYAGMILIVPVYYVFPRHRMIWCSLIGLVVAASFTRAVLLVVPIAAIIYNVFRLRGFAVTLMLAGAGVVLVLMLGDIISALSENSSTNGHVLSITQVFDFLDPLTMLSGAVFTGTLPEFEPGLFNLLFLFGIVPLVLFIVFIRGIYLRNAAPGSLTPYIAIVMLTGTLTLAVISSVFLATTSGWFAWFLAGFASKRSIVMLPGAQSAVRHPPLSGDVREVRV